MQEMIRWLRLVGLVLLVSHAAVVPAQEEATEQQREDEAGEGDISMNFQDVELSALVKYISEITNRNFIIDERVKGKVTIISPSKITVDEAYNVFRSVLQVKGFTTVPSGSVIKILPVQEAKSSTLETVLPGVRPSVSDEFITRLMKLEHVEADNMLQIVQPLVSANGLLASYPPTNTLIVIDSAANINRVAAIIKELDVPGTESRVEVIRLNYAVASELAGTLGQVLEEPQQAGAAPPSPAARPPRTPSVRARGAQPPGGQTAAVTGGKEGGEAAYKIIPDDRINALIVVAGKLQMNRIKELITRLDVPLPLGTGRIHVYYLKYANAFEVVPILSDLIGGTGGVGGMGGGLLSRAVTRTTAFRGGRLGQQGRFGAFDEFGGGLGAWSGALGGRAQRLGAFGGGYGGLGGGYGSLRTGARFGAGVGSPAGQGGVTSAAGGGGGEFEGEVRITADPSTNTLIIYASPQDFQTLKRVIELIDVRRRQVYVEAILLEVGLRRSRELGIEMQGGTGLDKGVGLGRVAFGAMDTALANPTSLSGLIAAAASNQTVRLPNGAVVPAQMLLLHASQSNNDLNLLSAPTLLTTDNQEAEIVVGQNVPFIGSRSVSETNLANTFATIDRRDVGITLRLTPQISEGGMVRLDIFAELSSVVEQSVAGLDPNLVGPTTTIRSATTTVVVRDAQTVVIGGMIADDTSKAVSGVPFFVDIPVLGHFFRSTTSRQEKRNLLIFLTPHIIRSAAQHRDFSLRKRDEVKDFMAQRDFRDRRPEYLDQPSWNPELPAEQEKTEEGELGTESQREDGGSEFRMVPGTAPPAEAETLHEEETAPPVPVVSRFVLLASIVEHGAPPEDLATATGMLALSLPEGSPLIGFFQKGGKYRFRSGEFEAVYQCLDAFTAAREALLVYPEGLAVDPQRGEYLHWRELREAATADPQAWASLN